MKILLFLGLFCLAFFNNGNSQFLAKQKTDSKSVFYKTAVSGKEKDEAHYKRMRTSGFVLGGAGVAVAVTGIVLSGKQDNKTSGTIIMLGGLAAVAGSSFIIAHSNRRLDELKSVSLGGTHNGAGLTFRF
ncbi:hypothetical protein [Niabella beijingensis]|uniref:hypothetical protein n=1 Tax=Niabella beijingensis TaxID=2872700 RepID=UPI001CBC5240|nr:hypothetical protein [Niabella beijingensis]MBZ4189952.1 hypothetical protein [Niabella beijingensis]